MRLSPVLIKQNGFTHKVVSDEYLSRLVSIDSTGFVSTISVIDSFPDINSVKFKNELAFNERVIGQMIDEIIEAHSLK